MPPDTDVETGRLAELLTVERLRSYLAATQGDLGAALRLYEWNADASSAALGLTAMVEILLRNALDRELEEWARRRAQADWLDTAPLDGRGRHDVVAARRRAARGGSPTHGHVVAELNLGFWRYLVSRRYLTSLWVPALRHAFPGGPRDARARQHEVEAHVEQLHYLRNRAAHHEPIHRRDLASDLERAVLLAGWIDPVARRWVVSRERLGALVAARPTGSQIPTASQLSSPPAAGTKGLSGSATRVAP